MSAHGLMSLHDLEPDDVQIVWYESQGRSCLCVELGPLSIHGDPVKVRLAFQRALHEIVRGPAIKVPVEVKE